MSDVLRGRASDGMFVSRREAHAFAEQSYASWPEVSLVIPAYNEEDRLEKTVVSYAGILRESFPAFEVVIVANGCTDGTVALAERIAGDVEGVRVVEIVEPVGKGGAVVEGFAASRGKRVVFADADCATSPESLVSLIGVLEHSDVVVGSRRMEGSVIRRPQPLPRRIAGATFAAFVRTFFAMPIRDTQCGAKGFRADVAKSLALQVTERRWAFDVELLLLAFGDGYSICEHPVDWTDMDGSRLRYLDTAKEVLGSLWGIRQRLALRAKEAPEVRKVGTVFAGRRLRSIGADKGAVFVEDHRKAS